MSNGIGASRIKVCPQDRRRGRRYELDWVIRVTGTSRENLPFEEEAVLRNLSSSGAYARLTNSPRVGAKLSIAIKLPLKQDNWMCYSATAVRVEQALPSGTWVALRFDSIRPGFEKNRD